MKRIMILLLTILVVSLQMMGETTTTVDYRNWDEGLDHAVWTGEVVFPSDWSAYQPLPASCFVDAEVGNVIRLCHTNLRGGAQAILRTSGWGVMPGMEGIGLLSGRHSDILISDEMLRELQANGCLIHGIGFTLTAVEILSKKDRPKLQTGVPEVNDWMWSSPEVPTFRVHVANPDTVNVKFNIEIRISDDKLQKYQDFTWPASLAPDESRDYEFNPVGELAPGFYQATIHVAGEVARAFYFGYDAEKLVSSPDMQPDFLDFWQSSKVELAAVDPSFTMTEIPERSTTKRKLYLVEMRSVADGTGEGIVRAFYAEPTAEGTYPVVVHFCAYDDGLGELSIPHADDHPDRIDMVVSTRGQSINNRTPYVNPYGDWLTYGFGDRQTWYYRGAFLDCVRSLDFLQTRPKVQPENVFAEGASQGGAFTYAAAALSDGRLNAIAPAASFLGDFPDYFELVPWPGTTLRLYQQALGMSDEAFFTMLSYFDTKNLAALISCPAMMNFSLQDLTCPPHTVWAPYNNLGSQEKRYLVNPALGHTVGETWVEEYTRFFLDHLKGEADGICTLRSDRRVTDDAIYDLRGLRHEGSLSTLPSGIYIQHGRKVVK